MSWIKRILGIAKKSAQDVIEDANELLVDAAELLVRALRDKDGNGFPDKVEAVARQSANMVAALEIIHPQRGGGAIKANLAMQEILAASGRALAVWELAKPFIDAAVKLLPRNK